MLIFLGPRRDAVEFLADQLHITGLLPDPLPGPDKALMVTELDFRNAVDESTSDDDRADMARIERLILGLAEQSTVDLKALHRLRPEWCQIAGMALAVAVGGMHLPVMKLAAVDDGGPISIDRKTVLEIVR